MAYVDAHLHLADAAYSQFIPEIIEDARQNSVSHLLSNSMDYQTSMATLEIAKRYRPIVLPAVGVHPWTANSNLDPQLEKVEELLATNEGFVKAIGEIGLDGKYNQNAQTKQRQRETFETLLRVAEKKTLPVVIHSRLAIDEVLETLTRYKLSKVLLHWYDGPIDRLSKIHDSGYFISIGPVVTYSRRISEIAQQADLKLILTETDGPVTYGGPYKSRTTKPSFVIDVVRKLAEIRSIELVETRETILSNFMNFLGM